MILSGPDVCADVRIFFQHRTRIPRSAVYAIGSVRSWRRIRRATLISCSVPYRIRGMMAPTFLSQSFVISVKRPRRAKRRFSSRIRPSYFQRNLRRMDPNAVRRGHAVPPEGTALHSRTSCREPDKAGVSVRLRPSVPMR